MNWMFKRDSPLRSSLRRKYSFTPSPKVPEGACLEVFQTHWQQAFAIIQKNGPHTPPTSDDITGVINNLDQMITLLLQEAQQSTSCLTNGGTGDPEPTGPLLSYLLMEGCLDKLLSWSMRSGEFVNILKLEQLKFYEVLVTNCHQDLLFHKPVVQPLLRLLASCGECSPVEVEKRLVILLNTLCVCLTQFPDLLQVFFGASSDHGSTRSEKKDMFLIFSLLIPFVHREGAIGQQARDALLLCMALSRRNESIGVYIAEHSNFCPVLATGLSGLYSLLPRKLPEVPEDWLQFTAEDIAETPELTMFLNSLEFCNAVIQVAHPMVQEQLMEYLYQGFLVPVLGPALHQDAVAVPVQRLERMSKFLNTVEEIIATTAYLELFLRTITEPILLQMFLKFILTSSYDGHHVLNSLVDRLGAQSRLCLVTMALFKTLLDLNCEDVLFELVFRYLIPCTHMMVSQRSRVRDIDFYHQAADKFLSLTPVSSILHNPVPPLPSSQSTPTPFTSNFSSLQQSISRGGSLRLKRHHRSPSTSSLAFGDFDRLSSGKQNTEWYISTGGFELSSYMDYLKAAHTSVKACTLACRGWSARYDGLDPVPSALGSSSQGKDGELQSEKCKNKTGAVEEGKKVFELSSANLAAHQDSLKEVEEPSIEKQFLLKSLYRSKDDVVNSDILNEIINTDDERTFWRLVCATNTPPFVDDDNDDSLETIDGYFNDIDEYESKLSPCCPDAKDECSNPDSGVFETGESCVSERDADLALPSAKANEHKEPLFIPLPQKPEPKRGSSSSKSSSSPASPSTWETFGSPNIGPFLSILLTRLEMMMQNDVYTNLHLTGLISRLACYPQPLLRSFLLNPSLVFQPTVRSLFQVLGSLKHKIDSYSCTVENYEELVAQSRQFLSEREQHLSFAPANRVYSDSLSRTRCSTVPEHLTRGEPRRRSLTNFLFRKSSFLRNREHTVSKEPSLESISSHGYRFVKKPAAASLEGDMESVKTKNAIFCAVVLEDFLKELAAIAQEHSIIQLNPDFWDMTGAPWEG